MKKSEKYKAALSKAKYSCSMAERCRSDIYRSLMKWDVSEEDAERIIEELIREKYIDEDRYAELYIKDKYKLNKWGRIKIEFTLRQKGIDQNTISAAMDDGIEEEEYRKNLFELLHEKKKSIKGKNTFEIKGKLLRFAQGRGFETDLVFSILDELFTNE